MNGLKPDVVMDAMDNININEQRMNMMILPLTE